MRHTHLPFDIVCLAESELPYQHLTLCTLLWESEGKEGRREAVGEKREEVRQGEREERKEENGK